MKVTSKQVFYGVTLVGLVVILLVYLLVYMKYTNLATEISDSNVVLRQEVNDLKVYFDSIPTYQAQMEEMKTATDLILAEYPADAREEDALMLAVNVQGKAELTYSSINMAESEVVYPVPVETVMAASMEGYEEGINFVEKKVTFVNETDYDNLKECVAAVYSAPNRIGINNIAYSRNDQTGTLNGNIDISFYSATGTGKEYVVPDMREYISGAPNPFQMFVVPEIDESAEAAEE